jgi:hypothetical protein
MSVNGTKVIAAVRKAAQDNPTQTVTDCVYVRDGKPCCLVGQGLWAAQLIHEEFESSNHNFDNITSIGAAFGLDNAEVEWLSEVQANQDGRSPWAVAVSKADKDFQTMSYGIDE